MATPRYSEIEVWRKMIDLWAGGRTWKSLVQRNKYTTVSLHTAERRCEFEYQSGNRKWIELDILYSLYEELYRAGRLSGRDFSTDPDYCERVTGRRYWHAPGAAMMALLPLLDDRVGYANGELFIAPKQAQPW